MYIYIYTTYIYIYGPSQCRERGDFQTNAVPGHAQCCVALGARFHAGVGHVICIRHDDTTYT